MRSVISGNSSRRRSQSKKRFTRQDYKVKVTAPCMSACPSHLPIVDYIEKIKEGRFLESLEATREATCLPGVLGRVCVRPVKRIADGET